MSTHAKTKRQRGFALIEITVTSFVVLMTLGAATSLMGTTSDLTLDCDAQTRAHEEHRRNLTHIGSILRTASGPTLYGFKDGVATEPQFQRIYGVDLRDYLYTDVQRIVWRPATQPVDGVQNPGALWLVDPAGDEILAARVPKNGFELRREGNLLAVRLTTYYAKSAEHVAQVTSETAVALRN